MLLNVNEQDAAVLRHILAQFDAQTGAGLPASAPVACLPNSTVRARKAKKKVKADEAAEKMAKHLGSQFLTFLKMH